MTRECFDERQHGHRRVAADVEDLVQRVALRSSLGQTRDALDDVIDVREIAREAAVAEHWQRLPGQ
jgi:hypothetical protein